MTFSVNECYTIKLAPVNWSLIKRFPYPLKTMYVMILKHLVRRKIIGEFKKAVIDSGLSAIFDEVQDLDYLINTFVFNDNTIKFKDEIIKVNNLNLMRNCYNTLNEDLLYTDTPKDYKEVNLDLFNLLKTDRELRGNLIKLLITLKNLYLNEVNTFYPKEWKILKTNLNLFAINTLSILMITFYIQLFVITLFLG